MSKFTMITMITCITALLLNTIAIDGFLITPANSVPSMLSSRQTLSSIYAKDKEEDLEMTLQVIREFIEKNGDDLSNTNTESESAPVAVTVTEEK
jgi:hypothetical protein